MVTGEIVHFYYDNRFDLINQEMTAQLECCNVGVCSNKGICVGFKLFQMLP